MVMGLAYHGTTSAPLHGIDNMFGKHIDSGTLESHLDLIGRRFTVVPLTDLVSRLRAGEPLRRRSLFLSFDDGYAGNFDVAFPLLRKFGFPATFFVTSGFVGTGRMLALDLLDSAIKASTLASFTPGPPCAEVPLPLRTQEDKCAAAHALRIVFKRLAPPADMDFMRRTVHALGFAGEEQVPPMGPQTALMKWAEIAAMAAQGMEIGSHTHTHRILARIGASEASAELSESRRTVEKHAGVPCRLFCYPNGKFGRDGNRDTDRLVREAGYDGAVYLEGGVNTTATDPYRITRHPAGMRTSRVDLMMSLAGIRPRVGLALGRG
jgi:peptidoglycan/xylan/chitin deacetylase (PgdA/CDA1 family)